MKRASSFVVDKAGDAFVAYGLPAIGTVLLGFLGGFILWWIDKLSWLWPDSERLWLVAMSPFTWVIVAFLTGYITKSLVLYFKNNNKKQKALRRNEAIENVYSKFSSLSRDLKYAIQYKDWNGVHNMSVQSNATIAFNAFEKLGIGMPILPNFPNHKSYIEQHYFIEKVLPFLKERQLEPIKDLIERINQGR